MNFYPSVYLIIFEITNLVFEPKNLKVQNSINIKLKFMSYRSFNFKKIIKFQFLLNTKLKFQELNKHIESLCINS